MSRQEERGGHLGPQTLVVYTSEAEQVTQTSLIAKDMVCH